MNNEVLRKIRESMDKRLEGSNGMTGDEWLDITKGMLPIYLQLCILDKLESIESDIAAMSSDSWNDHHNK